MTVNTSTVTEINKVALQLYDTVEVIGNQALRILMTGPTPPPTDLSGAKL
jgi:predicted solute-binding protein